MTSAPDPYAFECGPNNAYPSTHHNTFLSNQTTLSFSCKGGPPSDQNQPLAGWQKGVSYDGTPREAGSAIGPLPTDAQLEAAAHRMLQF